MTQKQLVSYIRNYLEACVQAPAKSCFSDNTLSTVVTSIIQETTILLENNHSKQTFNLFLVVLESYYFLNNYLDLLCLQHKFKSKLKADLDVLWEFLSSPRIKRFLRKIRNLRTSEKVERVYANLFKFGRNYMQKQALAEKLRDLELKAKKNLKDNTPTLFLPASDVKELTWYNKSICIKARNLGRSRGLAGFLFVLDDETVNYLLKYCKNRDVRKLVYTHYTSLLLADFSGQNQKMLMKAVSLKEELAKLYGYSTYADLITSEFVLNRRASVDYLNYAHAESIEHSRTLEVAAKATFHEEFGDEEMMPWDHAYYQTKLIYKNEQKESEVFFTWSTSFPKILKNLSELFELHLSIENKYDSHWTIKIETKDKAKSALLIVDSREKSAFVKKLYPVQISLSNRVKGTNKELLPGTQYVALNIKNVKKLKFQDMVYILHEFGHVIHAFFEETHTESNFKKIGNDLTELPSQLLEKLAMDYTFMRSVSCKYLPKKYFDNWVAAYTRLENISKEKEVLRHMLHFDLHVKTTKKELTTMLLSNHKKGIFYNPCRTVDYLEANHLNDHFSYYIYSYSNEIAKELFTKLPRNEFSNFYKIMGQDKRKVLTYLDGFLPESSKYLIFPKGT